MCRTGLGYDRNGLGYRQNGRGNVTPVTINIPRIGICHGICLGEREVPDIDGFFKELDAMENIAIQGLLERFEYICKQSGRVADFMYDNDTMSGRTPESTDDTIVRDVMKHGTLAVGYIGLAETCQAMFGKDFVDDKEVLDFAVSIVKHIYDKCKAASSKFNLNFGCYGTPAEALCGTFMSGKSHEVAGLREDFGIIKNVTDRDFLTNSHHVPVWKEVGIFEKIDIESNFVKYATAGCITYVELDSSCMNNEEAIETIIDYALDKDIPYLAFNFPLDTCGKCNYQAEIGEKCPQCGNDDPETIQRLRRVTGYLSSDYRHFNHAKQEETKQRVKHSKFTKGFNIL